MIIINSKPKEDDGNKEDVNGDKVKNVDVDHSKSTPKHYLPLNIVNRNFKENEEEGDIAILLQPPEFKQPPKPSIPVDTEVDSKSMINIVV